MSKQYITAIFFAILLAGYLLVPLVSSASDLNASENRITLAPAKASLPNFANIRDVKEKKYKFFQYLYPYLTAENNKLANLRARILSISSKLSEQKKIPPKDLHFIEKLVKKYRIETSLAFKTKVFQLQHHVDEIPIELVMVQAANESAWGTSRFARKGLNFFGMWCFKKGCGIVPKRRNLSDIHEVKVYESVAQSIEDYFYNINSNKAYKSLRSIRKKLRDDNALLDARLLAKGLILYSERGEAYVNEIIDMIDHNQKYFIDLKHTSE